MTNKSQNANQTALDLDAIRRFRRKIFRFHARHKRDLPFRRTTDPYKITVAELMLQQTQVDRVLPKYRAWTRSWPDWTSLARATRREVLSAWSGLGYNRRALYLHETARIVSDRFNGHLPESLDQLRSLPGIGRYTSAAILIFARNEPLVAIDTNIRKVLIAELGLSPTISQAALEAVAKRLLPAKRARDWHNALMDYGSLKLPRIMKGINALPRQSRFDGSLRQIRGEIVRRLTGQDRVGIVTIARALKRSPTDVHRAAESLVRDGIVLFSGKTLTLKDG
jgi:A/G-specific adenine glycosylase